MSDGNATRVALALSASAPEKIFTLAAPARVVIDLRHTRMRAGVRPPPGAGIVARIRTGPRADGTLRVVIELNSTVATHSHWLARPPGPQQDLVVDLGDARATPGAGGIARSGTPPPRRRQLRSCSLRSRPIVQPAPPPALVQPAVATSRSQPRPCSRCAQRTRPWTRIGRSSSQSTRAMAAMIPGRSGTAAPVKRT
jgi:hypothetical protein